MITLLHNTVGIICPLCAKYQIMLQDQHTNIWYPISPFCCEIMKLADCPEWNNLIDITLEKVLK